MCVCVCVRVCVCVCACVCVDSTARPQQDAVAMAIPSAQHRKRAVQTLLTARGALLGSHRESMRRLPDLEGNRLDKGKGSGGGDTGESKPWWVPPPMAQASADATADVSEMSNISRATFSRFLKPQTQPANLLVGGPIGQSASKEDAGTHWLAAVPEEVSEEDASTPTESQLLVSGWEAAWDGALLSTSSNLDFLRQEVQRGLTSALDLTGQETAKHVPGADQDAAKPVEIRARPLLQTIQEGVLGILPSPRASGQQRSMAKLVRDLSSADPVSEADVVAQARNLHHLSVRNPSAETAVSEGAAAPGVKDEGDEEKVEMARAFLRGVKNMRSAAANATQLAQTSGESSSASSSQVPNTRELASQAIPPLMMSGRSDGPGTAGLDFSKGTWKMY